MDFGELLESTLEYARDNILIAIVVGIILLIFFYRRPKLLIGILLIAAILYGLFSMIMSLGETTSQHKQKMLNEGQRQLNRLE